MAVGRNRLWGFVCSTAQMGITPLKVHYHFSGTGVARVAHPSYIYYCIAEKKNQHNLIDLIVAINNATL